MNGMPAARCLPPITIAFLALAASATPISVQTTISARVSTLTPYGNFVTVGARSATRVLPAQSKIASPGLTVGVNAGNTSAATIIGWRVRGSIASLDVSEQGTALASSAVVRAGTTQTLRGDPVPASQSLLFELVGRPGTRGLLEMWGSGLVRPGAQAKYAVDVGNNGRVDWSVAATSNGQLSRREGPATIPASGTLSIRITSEASVALRTGSSVYKSGISVRFTPGMACSVAQYGNSCGPLFSGSWQTIGRQRTLELVVRGRPLAPGVLLIGDRALALQIPGSRCFLHATALTTGGFATDRNGQAVHRFTIPSNLSFRLFAQDALFSANLQTIQTTPGLRIECR